MHTFVIWFILALYLVNNIAVADNGATLDDIIVTAPPPESSEGAAIPVTVLSNEELRVKVGHSIGETLKSELGITSQSFGPGVGTPVIRGQSGPRVRVLANGIGGNDASAISPDHASSVEPLLAERIEVLRGPATLLYGSGAIGGVVNVIDNRIPEKLPGRLLGGALEQRLDSVSDETATTVKMEGNKAHLAYHIDGFFRDRNNVAIGGNAINVPAARQVDPTLPVNLQNSHGIIANSSSNATSGSAGLSLIGDTGFAGLAVNNLENNYGIAPDGTGGEITRIDLQQSKYDLKGELKKPLGFIKLLRIKLGYTDYQHTEIPNGQAAAFFTNKTYESRLELTHKTVAGVQGMLGFQAIASDFAAIDKSTLSTIVPESLTHSYGVFGMESLPMDALKNQLGWRVEDTTLTPQLQNDLNYHPISASASSLWQINDGNSLNLAMTRSQRAPQVQELLVHGYHDATRSFEVGNIHLHEETSYNLDLGYKFDGDWMRAEVDLFHNWANDYIYQQRNGIFVTEAGSTCLATDHCAPMVENRQGNATFMGYESKIILPLLESPAGLVDLTVFSDFTRGQFVNGADVPRMPPLRLGFQIDYALGNWENNLRMTRGEAQNHPGTFDSATPGYWLLNLGSQYQIRHFNGADMLLFAKANNLLNENILNSTSYLRNFAPEPGRGVEIGVRLSY